MTQAFVFLEEVVDGSEMEKAALRAFEEGRCLYDATGENFLARFVDRLHLSVTSVDSYSKTRYAHSGDWVPIYAVWKNGER